MDFSNVSMGDRCSARRHRYPQIVSALFAQADLLYTFCMYQRTSDTVTCRWGASRDIARRALQHLRIHLCASSRLKNQLRAERDEKRQMKERLKSTFVHTKQLKAEHAAAVRHPCRSIHAEHPTQKQLLCITSSLPVFLLRCEKKHVTSWY